MNLDKDTIQKAGEQAEKKLGAWAKYTLYGVAILLFVILTLLGLIGCNHSVSVNPDGSVTASRDGWSITISQVQEETDAEPKVIKAELK